MGQGSLSGCAPTAACRATYPPRGRAGGRELCCTAGWGVSGSSTGRTAQGEPFWGCQWANRFFRAAVKWLPCSGPARLPGKHVGRGCRQDPRPPSLPTVTGPICNWLASRAWGGIADPGLGRGGSAALLPREHSSPKRKGGGIIHFKAWLLKKSWCLCVGLSENQCSG